MGSKQGKVRREDTDDDVDGIVESEGRAEDVGRRGEAALPKTLADENDGSGAGLIFLGTKFATEDGINAKKREKFGGDHYAVQMFRLADAGEAIVGLAKGSHRGKRAVHFLPVEKVGIGDGSGVELRCFPIDRCELVGRRKRKWIENDSVDDGKERGVDADAKSHR